MLKQKRGDGMQVGHRLINADSDQTSTTELHLQAIERVISTMQERLYESLSLDDMADIALLSPYHFSRVFSRMIGIPPGEYFAALRLQEAKRLLLTTSLSVTDICFELGYSSLGSFTTRFTQLVGAPPRNLRRRAENFSAPPLESLRDTNTRLCCSVPLEGSFFGHVSAATPFTGLIFVGLFPRPVPQGQPVCCTVLPAPGLYFMRTVPDGCYYVLAAAFPLSKNPQAYCSQDSGLLVGMGEGSLVLCNGKMSGDPDITLRPRRLTDPPLVMALPFL